MSLFVDSSQHDSDGNTPAKVFSASTTQISHLADVLSSMVPVSSQALMIISPKGITLYGDYNHICNIQVSLDASLFTTFNFYAGNSQETEELRLCIDVKLMADCFNTVVSTSKPKKAVTSGPDTGETKCYINYHGEGTPFVVEFEDNVLSESLEFSTFYSDISYPYDAWERSYDVDDDYGLILNYNEVQFELILKSDIFFQVLRDLELVNTVDLFLVVSNEVKYLGIGNKAGPRFIDNSLHFVSKGFMGHSKLMYPPEKSILEKLIIYEPREDGMVETNGSMTTSYNYNILKNVQKAVKLSSKCKIRKDMAGTLSIQLLCRSSMNSYSGTLITFNMMEASTDAGALTKNKFNEMFDDDYQFRTDDTDMSEYQDLGKMPKPTMSYDMFQHKDGEEENQGVPLFF